MKYLCVEVWDSKQQLAEFASKVNDDYDRIIVFGQNEHHISIVKQYNLDTDKIDVLTGASIYHIPKTYKSTGWDTWFFIKTYAQLLSNSTNLNFLRKLIHQKTFKRSFASFNYRAHDHRCHMIDALAKHNLIDVGLITWHWMDNFSDYQFEYFQNRRIWLDDAYHETGRWHDLPKEYEHTFAHLVSESTMDAVFITEKTAIPILHFKPFLVSGPKHFYKRLDEMGIERFTELFDYSFDDVDDHKLRAQMVVENINRIARLPEHHLAELHEKIKPKLAHNFYKVEEIVYDFDNWHPLAKECIEQSNVLGYSLNKWINDSYRLLTVK